ncbi:MAG: hypothetical protein LBG57_13825 [Treponema sp.]|jgi:hypothetical protein|nr:hypothetical protein [Treponema sp.]
MKKSCGGITGILTALRMWFAFRQETVSYSGAQGIEAEIPQARRRRAEELERIARSPRSGDAPKFQYKSTDLIVSGCQEPVGLVDFWAPGAY